MAIGITVNPSVALPQGSATLGSTSTAQRPSLDKGWDSLVKSLEQQIAKVGTGRVEGVRSTAAGEMSAKSSVNLGELLKLQVDMHRCQIKVELLSKVSESASATFKKLEQAQ